MDTEYLGMLLTVHSACAEALAGPGGGNQELLAIHYMTERAIQEAVAQMPAEQNPRLPLALACAVTSFEKAMVEQLAANHRKGVTGWDTLALDYLWERMQGQLEQGDMVSAANFAMMIHVRPKEANWQAQFNARLTAQRFWKHRFVAALAGHLRGPEYEDETELLSFCFAAADAAPLSDYTLDPEECAEAEYDAMKS